VIAFTAIRFSDTWTFIMLDRSSAAAVAVAMAAFGMTVGGVAAADDAR
jgi:hypothetical protein